MTRPSAPAPRRVCLLLASLLASCEPSPPEEREAPSVAPPPPAPAPVAPAPPSAGALYTVERRLMGTVFIIRVDAPAEVAEPAVAAAFDEIARLERILSEWRDDSEISRINRSAGRAPVEVGPETLDVVRAGLEVSRWSEGAFDLSWAALHGLYDFRPDSHRLPSPEEVRARLPRIRWQDIVLDEGARTVFLRREGMAIGTGGIGKGYALDRAGAILREAGIASYMLFGGGQVQVHGLRGDRPWRVGIQHPRRPDAYFAFLESTGGSISTSGDYEHFFVDGRGRRWHHIIDPRTGEPADRSVAVTLLAPTGLYADALSTATFVLGPERALAMLERLPFQVEAVILGPECRLVTTPGTRAHLHFRMELVDGAVPGCR